MALGVALQDMLKLAGAMPQQQPQTMPEPAKRGRGDLLLGILADALQGAAGQPGTYAQLQGQRRQQEQQQAQWGLRRQGELEDYEKKQQIEQRYRQPDVSPMERDVQAYQRMTPEQRQTYQQLQQAKAPDPDVFITLPNGQVYAGPRSGLSAAMMGGGQVPPKPVGKLTPINGGPTAAPSGGFL